MHVEKNVFNTPVGTMLYIEGKTKDTIKAQIDLRKMGIRPGLWMTRDDDIARKKLASFFVKPDKRKEFLQFLYSIQFPDWYASNIDHCVNMDGGTFSGLKSHDCHVILQRHLPVGIRHFLPEDVVKSIMLFARYFSQLTARSLHNVEQLGNDIIEVLCKFKQIFPSAFFRSIIHIMIHLPDKVLLAGPVNYQWMYPIEMYLIIINTLVGCMYDLTNFTC